MLYTSLRPIGQGMHDAFEKAHGPKTIKPILIHRDGKTFYQRRLVNTDGVASIKPLSGHPKIDEAKGEKLDAKAKEYSDETCQKIIDKYYTPKFKEHIKELLFPDNNVCLVPMPSTTGTNKLPHLLAKRISEDFNVPVLNGHAGTPLHKKAVKSLYGLDRVIHGPDYSPNEETLDAVKDKRLILVDDLYTTGSSGKAMAKRLHEKGYTVDSHILCLAGKAGSKTSGSQLELLAGMISQFKGLPKEEVKEKLTKHIGHLDSTVAYQTVKSVGSGYAPSYSQLVKLGAQYDQLKD